MQVGPNFSRSAHFCCFAAKMCILGRGLCLRFEAVANRIRAFAESNPHTNSGTVPQWLSDLNATSSPPSPPRPDGEASAWCAYRDADSKASLPAFWANRRRRWCRAGPVTADSSRRTAAPSTRGWPCCSRRRTPTRAKRSSNCRAMADRSCCDCCSTVAWKPALVPVPGWPIRANSRCAPSCTVASIWRRPRRLPT